MRREILKKIDLDEKQRLEDELEGNLEELNDAEFKEKLIKELE